MKDVHENQIIVKSLSSLETYLKPKITWTHLTTYVSTGECLTVWGVRYEEF